ncbi:MAG: metallophosphoesterase [Lachnospiraceae bacterium]|nr:metallophosphoesterase [Lachnospiraceae bacterium]MBR1855292.1 metallophosphoesterase [Lachnospiraceae bacterium]
MKTLVIPDIHLKPWIFDEAEKLMRKGAADSAVCLMDIPDDWNKAFKTELYAETYDRAIRFAKDFPSTKWCYGNHDVCYLWNQRESGFSVTATYTVCRKLFELESALTDSSLIAFVHRTDHVLFSHGGLRNYFIREVMEAESSETEETAPEMPEINFDTCEDIDRMLALVNSKGEGWMWSDESPIWYRPQYESSADLFRREGWIQVVGHTPVEKIYDGGGFISTDVFSTYQNGRQIGESAFLVIDTQTCEWEKQYIK